jgi:hypothetical protein
MAPEAWLLYCVISPAGVTPTALQLSEALKLAATLYSEEAEGQGQQLSAP